jgi:septal ring factor EnvC (AmiA/AmiB activator)
MKKLLFAVMCAIMLYGMIAIVYAERDDWQGGIHSRINEAKQGIERGIEKGSLTRYEAKKLNEELDSIIDNIDRMKRDGKLSQSEREKININLDRLERDIIREKHDADWQAGIHSRINEAKEGIKRGIENGSLTRYEAKKLNEKLNSIIDNFERMKSEREKININLDRLERDIQRERHDDDTRR